MPPWGTVPGDPGCPAWVGGGKGVLPKPCGTGSGGDDDETCRPGTHPAPASGCWARGGVGRAGKMAGGISPAPRGSAQPAERVRIPRRGREEGCGHPPPSPAAGGFGEGAEALGPSSLSPRRRYQPSRRSPAAEGSGRGWAGPGPFPSPVVSPLASLWAWGGFGAGCGSRVPAGPVRVRGCR